jgi:hypothetical protein
LFPDRPTPVRHDVALGSGLRSPHLLPDLLRSLNVMNRHFGRAVHAAGFGSRLRNNADNHLIERAVAQACLPWSAD